MEQLGYRLGRVIYQNNPAGIYVHEAQDIESGLIVVVKLIACQDMVDMNAILDEAMTQKGLDHPSVCKVIKAGVLTSGAFIVLEKLESDLAAELKKREKVRKFYSEAEIWEFLKQIVGALVFAQDKNILLDGNGNYKLCDFGNAKEMKQFGNSDHTFLGTPLYMSPQLREEMVNKARMQTYRKVPYNPYKSDVYSLGLTVLYMASLVVPNVLATLEDLQTKTLQAIGNINYSYKLQNILWWMLYVNEEGRPDFRDLRNYLASPDLADVMASVPSQQVTRDVVNPFESVPMAAQSEGQVGVDRSAPMNEGLRKPKPSLPISSQSNIYSPTGRTYAALGNPVPDSYLRVSAIGPHNPGSGAPVTNLTQPQVIPRTDPPMNQEGFRYCDWCKQATAANVMAPHCGHRFCSQRCYDQAIRASACAICRAQRSMV